jgi:hypothetical protein
MHFLDFQKSFSLRHCGLASACPARRPYISKSSVEQPLSSIGPSKVEKASLGGAKMCVRLVANLTLGIILSSPTWADTIRLHCSEALYDKTLNKPYEVPQVFILQDFSVLRWDNKKVDLSVVTSTPEAIEATGKATAYIYMPLPSQLDQCVNLELANHPTERDANGTVNKYLCLGLCKTSESV